MEEEEEDYIEEFIRKPPEEVAVEEFFLPDLHMLISNNSSVAALLNIQAFDINKSLKSVAREIQSLLQTYYDDYNKITKEIITLVDTTKRDREGILATNALITSAYVKQSAAQKKITKLHDLITEIKGHSQDQKRHRAEIRASSSGLFGAGLFPRPGPAPGKPPGESVTSRTLLRRMQQTFRTYNPNQSVPTSFVIGTQGYIPFQWDENKLAVIIPGGWSQHTLNVAASQGQYYIGNDPNSFIPEPSLSQDDVQESEDRLAQRVIQTQMNITTMTDNLRASEKLLFNVNKTISQLEQPQRRVRQA